MFVPFELTHESGQQTTCKSLSGSYDRWARYRHPLRGACPLTGEGAWLAALRWVGLGRLHGWHPGCWLPQHSPPCTPPPTAALRCIPPPPAARKFPPGTEDAVYALADTLSFGSNTGASSSDAARLRAGALSGSGAPRKQN